MNYFTENSLLDQLLKIGRDPVRQGFSIRKVWHIIDVSEGSVLELRALWPHNFHGKKPSITLCMRAGDYVNIAALKAKFEDTALGLNEQGYNIYTVMNPIRPDFNGPGAAKDADILYRGLLLIDIDRKGDKSLPANQAELDAAKSLAQQIRLRLSSLAFPDPVVMMSGNGYHLYYVLAALPNDSDTEVAIRSLLKNLARTYDNDIVGVDTVVYNASRITKVPGTIMRKGIATIDRPYRMAEVCDEE